MANYPFVSPQDESSQYLASILQQYKPGTLGNTATIGNPQGQQDYAAQLAQALAEMETSSKQQQRASTLQNPEFIQNSGGLGVLAMLAQAYAGKKMDEKAGKKYEDASMRAMTARSVLDEAKSEREAARALKASQDEQAQRRKDGEAAGLTGRDLTRYALEGKMGEGVRGVPMMTDQGLVNVDPYTGTASRIQQGGQQQAPPNVRIDPNLPPEIQAAIAAHERNGSPIPDELNVTGQQGGALMPYKDPAIAQRQAMADNRADESLGLARRAADRADNAETRAADAARRTAEAEQRKLNAPNTALAQWNEARSGLESGLAGSETGPLMGRIPAFTSEQQIAEGAVAATAPILKQLFRTAGEGTFTDKDQDLLMRMVPTRTDTPEARQSKIENIDRIIRAKLGAGSAAAPQGDDDGAPMQRIRIKL